MITYERPSRASRVLVFLSALVVLAAAAWVLTPIVLTQYPAAATALSMFRDVVGDGGISESRRPVAPPAERETREARDLVIDPPPERRDPPEVVEVEQPTPPVAEVQDNPPAPALAATSSEAVPANEAVGSIAPGALVQWAPVSTAPWSPPDQRAGAAPEAETIDAPNATPADFGRVPLPRRRPDAATIARLGIPLPRPRPAEIPAAVETIPAAEQILFDRQSVPN